MGSGSVTARFIPLAWVVAFSVLAVLVSAGSAFAHSGLDSAMVRGGTMSERFRIGGCSAGKGLVGGGGVLLVVSLLGVLHSSYLSA